MLTVESEGKVIFKKKYEGKKTTTEALNLIDSLGLYAVQYYKGADGSRIITAMTEEEY